MHAGRIDGDTAAGRVYEVLKGKAGEYVGGMELTLLARTTAVSTRISEVRRQLPAGERIERIGNRAHGQFYRLVVEAAA